MVDNYKEPQNRITQISFRTIHPDQVGAAPTWHLLCRCDIADQLAVTVDHPGGGGFSAVQHFIEGVHEEASALNPDYDDVTLTLDLSPAAYYQENPWA